MKNWKSNFIHNLHTHQRSIAVIINVIVLDLLRVISVAFINQEKKASTLQITCILLSALINLMIWHHKRKLILKKNKGIMRLVLIRFKSEAMMMVQVKKKKSWMLRIINSCLTMMICYNRLINWWNRQTTNSETVRWRVLNS